MAELKFAGHSGWDWSLDSGLLTSELGLMPCHFSHICMITHTHRDVYFSNFRVNIPTTRLRRIIYYCGIPEIPSSDFTGPKDWSVWWGRPWKYDQGASGTLGLGRHWQAGMINLAWRFPPAWFEFLCPDVSDRLPGLLGCSPPLLVLPRNFVTDQAGCFWRVKSTRFIFVPFQKSVCRIWGPSGLYSHQDGCLGLTQREIFECQSKWGEK